jgi:NitT/TauT family transport system substrate-binding protein
MSRRLIATAALALLAFPAWAETITINVGGLDKQIYLPAKLAEALGYYTDEGLNVELEGEAAGVEGADALIAGEAQGVVGFYDHTIDLASKGKHAESIVQFSRAPGEVELVAARIADQVKRFADLKGRALGVTGLGSSTNFLTQYMAVRSGLQPGDITSVAVGAGATFLAAMKQGAIDGGMTTEPTVSRALKTGLARVLIDMRTVEGTRAALGGTYPAACLYMATDYVRKHPDITQKLANAYVRTLRFIATHTGAEIAAKMPADYYAGDKEAYVKALDAGKAMFTPDGVMPEDGPPTVLKVLSAFSPTLKGKTVDVTQTYTTEFVKMVPPSQ